MRAMKRLTDVGASNVATSIEVDSDELAKSWGVVILDCFGIAKCFQDGVGLEQLLFQFSLRKERIKDRKLWISKAEKTRHCICLVPCTRKLKTEQSNLAGTMYMCVQFKPQAYIWVLFLGHWKTKSPHITIISCASQSNEFEPFSTATDKSQGLPVRPTEIEDINNKSQTVNNTQGQER